MGDEAYNSEQEVANLLSMPLDQNGDQDWNKWTQNYMLAKEYVKQYEVSSH